VKPALGAEMDDATTVFAEMEGFPLPQVFCIHCIADDWIRYFGATAFDVYWSR
jgi:hypothetical protein